MDDYIWNTTIEMHSGRRFFQCKLKECVVDIYPRPTYCDRGNWEVHVKCNGYPENPNPFDVHDGFPRYFFDAGRAVAEMNDMFRKRGYKPQPIGDENNGRHSTDI